jgi:small subunit ribosomal protein S16
MIKIRLARHGKKNDPFYRVVAIEESRKREGKPLEVIGFWHPAKNLKKINKKKLDKWLLRGAQITKAAAKLL